MKNAKLTEFNSLFEEDYLIRTLGSIGQDSEVALTELVANAWDAGASLVEIKIPDDVGKTLEIQDDGHGMNLSQFRERWMKLGYDRLKHQGSVVTFPKERETLNRLAYGRNGVGRHGLLCFANQYTVETWAFDQGTKFVIGTQSNTTPFKIESEAKFDKKGSGTKLSVVVQRRLPDPERIREILANRFLHDPQFKVTVNGKSLAIEKLPSLIASETLSVVGASPITVKIFDSGATARNTLYQGVAFWVNQRLVGKPSWILGNTVVVDGRTRLARTLSFVVQADGDWLAEVEPDWARFKNNKKVENLMLTISTFVEQKFKDYSADHVDESSEDVLVKNGEQFKNLSPLGRNEVAAFTQELVKSNPTINSDTLSLAVQAVINLEKSRGGAALLEKLIKLDESDIEGLDRLLSQWTIRDALSVLDEIDYRLSIVVAIDKLSGDPKTDELHTLHPLLTQARWVFGPEFDRPDYASNTTLKQIAQNIFHSQVDSSTFINPRQRPDILVVEDSTYSIVGTDGYDGMSNTLVTMQNILIIELKKGKSKIGRKEMSQADGYVEDFMNSGLMDGSPMIRAFVVGHELDDKQANGKQLLDRNNNVRGSVQATTYSQLVRSANQRLFRLKEKIPNRYEETSGHELTARVMQKASQAGLL